VELYSLRNDRTLATANFQFVAIWIFEEESVVAGTLIDADFRTFQIFATCVAHQFRYPIDFVACVGPNAMRVPFG